MQTEIRIQVGSQIKAIRVNPEGTAFLWPSMNQDEVAQMLRDYIEGVLHDAYIAKGGVAIKALENKHVSLID